MSSISGSVKWFNGSKGYGYITPDGGGNDVYVHFKSIIGDGYKSLYEGDLVEFEVEKNDHGYVATNVVKK
ncbi:cold-shock DNA-binding domain protein [Rhizoctonia solani AG-3 Rhs1AP]|uniref:Cold-shock DNA-binding domain protein n=2 Tax=Rhizoctonia solani AG-3 TaxID=1086053 RepID=A0A074S5Z9_9AGAM|nr:cold-shock DNA-binding domain protein [Rhizoctonia solani AG-3 Rhs1AP]KEP54841.1 cold-shock DNA-binding domain protein [Rhizoctonia solani 123E]